MLSNSDQVLLKVDYNESKDSLDTENIETVNFHLSNEHEDNTAPGCNLNREDLSHIIASFSCFLSMLVYGGCMGSLGAALPALAYHYNRSEQDFGFAFTTRGIGYFLGTISSAAVIEMPKVKPPLLPLACFATLIIGTATACLSVVDNYAMTLLIFGIQGIGAGGIDTYTNCLLPIIWNRRVAPWMQTMHAFFGIGAITGPTLVGSIGYIHTFYILGLSSLLPLLMFILHTILTYEKRSYGALNQQIVFENLDIDDRTTQSSDSPRVRSLDSLNTLDNNQNQTTRLAPWILRIIIFNLFLFYVGMETAYGGWISTYSLNEHVTDSKDNAAFVASSYWAALTAGRILAIPLAIIISTTTMIRIQLLLCCFGSVLVLLIASTSYTNILISSMVFGYALSSIFPLALTFLNDYGFTVDSLTTTLFVVGSTFGEAGLPIIVGYLMRIFGPEALAYVMVFFAALITSLYLLAHVIASNHRHYVQLNGKGKNSDNTDDIETIEFSVQHNPL